MIFLSFFQTKDHENMPNKHEAVVGCVVNVLMFQRTCSLTVISLASPNPSPMKYNIMFLFEIHSFFALISVKVVNSVTEDPLWPLMKFVRSECRDQNTFFIFFQTSDRFVVILKRSKTASTYI
jgi:hypothetical protein